MLAVIYQTFDRPELCANAVRTVEAALCSYDHVSVLANDGAPATFWPKYDTIAARLDAHVFNGDKERQGPGWTLNEAYQWAATEGAAWCLHVQDDFYVAEPGLATGIEGAILAIEYCPEVRLIRMRVPRAYDLGHAWDEELAWCESDEVEFLKAHPSGIVFRRFETYEAGKEHGLTGPSYQWTDQPHVRPMSAWLDEPYSEKPIHINRLEWYMNEKFVKRGWRAGYLVPGWFKATVAPSSKDAAGAAK